MLCLTRISCFDDIHADVIKLGHHGSDTSTAEEFLNAVSPSFAIISCGKDNQYGHPSEDVLTRLQENGVNVFRTDENGDVTVYSDGKEIVVETER